MMTKQYDFSRGRRGPVIEKPGKTRITIMLDDDVIEYFRSVAEVEGTGYQTQINSVLKQHAASLRDPSQASLTVETLRKVLREELGKS